MKMAIILRYPLLATVSRILGPFLIFFNTWGLLLSFGEFQSYYEETLLQGYSPSTISWIGTVSIFLLLVCGVFTGPAYDLGYSRILIIGGNVLVLLGVFVLSLSTKFYEILLSQGICFGLGSGLLYVPSVAGISRTFTKHRVMALGVAMSGASAGGIVYSVLLEQLLGRLSFGWMVRIIGFVMLGTTLIVLMCMMPESGTRSTHPRALMDSNAFRDPAFMLFCAGGFFVLVAYYLPFIYVPTVGASVGASPTLQLHLLTIVNGASLVGRVVPGWAADTLGALQSLPIAQFCSAIILFCWPAVTTVPGIIVWCCFWGFFSGMLIVMPGAAVPQLAPSLGLIGTWMGIAWFCCAFGILVGGPIGGAIVSDGFQLGMELLAAGSMLCGTMLCAVAALLKRRQQSLRDRTNASDVVDDVVTRDGPVKEVSVHSQRT